MQGLLRSLIRPKTCLNLLGRCCFSDLLCVLCVVNYIYAHRFDFTSRFWAHSIALRRTSTGSTFPFVVACAPPVGRKSDETFSARALDDADRAIHAASSPR